MGEDKRKDFKELDFTKKEDVVSVSSVPAGRVSMSDGLMGVFGKGKVTSDQNIHELGVADANLGMKTEINDPTTLKLQTTPTLNQTNTQP